MASSIFTEWLSKWNKKLVRKNRRILLFLDNTTCHPEVSLSNIKLVLLPPNTTTHLQPLDQGIIKVFKGFYRKKVIQRLIGLMDNASSATELVKKVNLRDVFYWARESWAEISALSIQKCFTKAGFNVIEENNEPDEDQNLMFNEFLGDDILDSISVEDFVTFDNSLVTSEEIADDFEEQMTRRLTQEPETIEVNSEVSDEDNEPEEVVSPRMTWSQGTQALLNLKRFLADYEFNDILNKLESVQDLDKKAVCKLRETKQRLLSFLT